MHIKDFELNSRWAPLYMCIYFAKVATLASKLISIDTNFVLYSAYLLHYLWNSIILIHLAIFEDHYNKHQFFANYVYAAAPI